MVGRGSIHYLLFTFYCCQLRWRNRLPGDKRAERERSLVVTRVLVLGGSGMLGSTVVDWLARDNSLNVAATVRTEKYLEACRTVIPEVRWHILDAEDYYSLNTLCVAGKYDWIINAIGVTPHIIHDDNPADVERAIQINALFPHCLARKAKDAGGRIIQIATDCVYAGRGGHYAEDAPHDSLDVYGKTKSLGEVRSSNVFHLRCSIVGPELKNHLLLLGWFLRQPLGAKVRGFTNHRWNGLTSLHFAKICHGIIKHNLRLPHLQHVVPADEMTKAEMLGEFARVYGRGDVRIERGETALAIDRTLRTKNEALNRSIWEAAGFPGPQSIADMIREMRSFDFRFGSLATCFNDQV